MNNMKIQSTNSHVPLLSNEIANAETISKGDMVQYIQTNKNNKSIILITDLSIQLFTCLVDHAPLGESK